MELPAQAAEFYARDPVDVARDLVGKHLVRETSAGLCGGRIVEVEAYLSRRDPACHASRGMTRRQKAVTLAVLAPAIKQRDMADIILSETTTLGVRIHPVQRFEAEREMQSVTTAYGIVQVKLKRWGGKLIGAMPEYEDCRKLAEAKGVSLRMVYESALAAAHEAFLAK